MKKPEIVLVTIVIIVALLAYFFIKSNQGGNQTDMKDRNRTATTKDIYLAGGCFWGLEEYMDRLEGVIDVTSGYANGSTENPTYEQVCSGLTGHAETVHVMYDTAQISLLEILQYYFRVIDPTSINKQGNDRGSQYRTGIFYEDEKDFTLIAASIRELQKEYDKPIVIQVEPLNGYYLAEDYHQDYLKKNPGGYCHIDLDLAFEPLEDFLPELKSDIVIDESLYTVPSKEELKDLLTSSQYAVAIENKTEFAFANEYHDNHEPGIYVDVASGVPLFSSLNKYDSFFGWPSFTQPISENVIIKLEDTTANMIRTEVRSHLSDIHLGHVFNDGPVATGGLRYCINSASLRFIHVLDMEAKGYGYLLKQ